LKNKKTLYLLLIFLVSIVSFGAIKKDVYRQVRDNQNLLNDIYRQLIMNYVDDIDIEAFTKLSINNMLLDLDPYTVYMEKEEKSGIEMLTKGKYGGVGIVIGQREKRLTVITPMENSPAKRAGIVSGDKIFLIDTTDTKNLSMDDAAKLIRGKRGSKIILGIKRYGEKEIINFTLTREEIKVKDISYYGMLDKQTGYIRLTRFSRNSDGEMKNALQDLLDKDMTGLIFDLRDNPGGLLNSAVNILDLFTEKGEMLVWTKGKTKKSTREYKSKQKPLVPENINITILVNQGSASASEIIAGTMQDLDRAVVIGRTTFGKGLVQTVVNIDKDKALKMTTAKYYIPSGRLIQKPGYLPKDILADTSSNDTIFYTKGGRVVSGGGGITPDHKVKLDIPMPILSAGWRQGLFFNFVQKNKNKYKELINVEQDDSLMNHFEDYLTSTDSDILMKGESNYLDMKDMLFKLDSNSFQVQGALEILDSYFEQKAMNQFDLETDNLKHWLMVEFSDYFDGEKGRLYQNSKRDKDILKAMEILNDPIAYNKVFLLQ
jgi:carboxyl-terminal processing protease